MRGGGKVRCERNSWLGFLVFSALTTTLRVLRGLLIGVTKAQGDIFIILLTASVGRVSAPHGGGVEGDQAGQDRVFLSGLTGC